jgi:PAS domain S-box-containing protein
MNDEVSHEKKLLRELLKAATTLLSGRSEEEVLHSILLGLKALGFDRVRLYLLSNDGQHLLPKAHIGMDDGFMQTPRRVADDRPMQVLLQEPRAHLFRAEEMGASSSGANEWICAPLILQGKITGKLSADNNLSNRPITADDCKKVAFFTIPAAAALEHTRLSRETEEQKSYLESLVSSSPLAIIANDTHGRVTQFNTRARELLGYTVTDVIPVTLRGIFADPNEPHKIRQLLDERNGRLRGHDTVINDKNGAPITIQMSATWLLDASGRRTGVVGHFEDLRDLDLATRRLQLLLDASNTVARADTPTVRLQGLAKLIVDSLPHSFCRILLADEQNPFLSPKAAYPVERKDRPLEWDPRLDKRIAINEVPGLADLLKAGIPRVVQLSDPAARESLEVFSHHLRLKHTTVQSVLMVPLKIEDKLIGLLEVGELRSEVRSPITPEEIDLVSAIAAQSTTLIDRLQHQEVNDHRRLLSEKLEDISHSLVPDKGVDALLQQAVRLAADLLGGTASAIYEYFSGPGSCELRHRYGKFDEILNPQPSLASKLLKPVCQSNELVTEHLAVDPSQEGKPSDPQMIAIGVPLREPRTGAVEYVLIVIYQPRDYHLTEVDGEFLQRLATRVALTVASAQVMSPEHRKLGLFPLLHRISDYLQSTRDVEKISHVVLTGITAGYGLGFNRAALFLMDESQHDLVGKMGIGHLSETAAQHDWEQGPRHRLEDVFRYLETLKAGTLAETPLDQVIRGLRLELDDDGQNPFTRCVAETSAFIVSESELSHLPSRFHSAFQPSSDLVFAPVRAGERVLGVVVADNKFLRHPIRLEDLDLLMALVNTAAIAISNLQLLDETKTAKDRIHALYEASEAVLTTQDPDSLIRNIVERLRKASGAARVSWVPIDDHGVPKEAIVAGGLQRFDVGKIRPDGITAEVLRRGMPVFIEDTAKARDRVNPLAFQEHVRALLCLPLTLDDARIGVMWLSYDEPCYFPEEEIRDFQFYVNQAVLAYGIARRRDNLERVRCASEALSAAATRQEVEDAIEQQAQVAFQATSVVVWIYDPRREQFLQAKSANTSISETLRQQFMQMEPRWRESAQHILKQEWVSVHDVNDAQYSPLITAPVREWLHQAGIQSYQAIALHAGSEPLGVIYVNYNCPRRFSDEEQTLLRMFGAQASLALRKAFLLDQFHNANAAAQTVAEVSALGELDTTLNAVTQGTLQALDCDAVTLYAYDQRTNTLSYPPKSVNLFYENQVRRYKTVASDSLIWTILKQDKRYYVVEKMEEDQFLAATRFAREEQIKSCIVLLLRAAGEKVGVMFVNYRTYHHFTPDELTRLQLYANQASVAIHNARLYEQAQKQAQSLQALHAAGQAISSSLDSAEVLRRIGEQAWRLTREDGEQVGITSVWQLENTRLNLVAAFSGSEQERLPLFIDLAPPANRRIGIMGRAVLQNQPQQVMDVTADLDYIPASAATKSGMAVPITVDGKVIGVINVEAPHFNAFQEQDAQVLAALAAQAGIAIENARQYEELERTKTQLAARTSVAWMGMASATWRHMVRTDAMTIRDVLTLARRDLDKKEIREKLLQRFDTIEKLANRIEESPATPVLSLEEDCQSVLVNEFIKERVTKDLAAAQLYVNGTGEGVTCEFIFLLPQHSTIRINSQWFAEALKIIIDNALEAMTNSPTKVISVTTQIENNGVAIMIADTGRGIPQEIRPYLLRKPIIKKTRGEKGTGMGLLLAQTILQAYEGDIQVGSTSSMGTTTVIWLPLESDEPNVMEITDLR